MLDLYRVTRYNNLSKSLLRRQSCRQHRRLFGRSGFGRRLKTGLHRFTGPAGAGSGFGGNHSAGRPAGAARGQHGGLQPLQAATRVFCRMGAGEMNAAEALVYKHPAGYVIRLWVYGGDFSVKVRGRHLFYTRRRRRGGDTWLDTTGDPRRRQAVPPTAASI